MSNSVDWDDELETELCYEDDDFVYRRKRPRRSDDGSASSSTSASASTQVDLEQERIDEYRKAIRYWEFLTDSLRKIEERPVSVGDEGVELSDGAVSVESVVHNSGFDADRVVDKLLVKAEAQEATISHVSIWTENWTSFLQTYGNGTYMRSAQDIAYHVALFIADKKGSYVNYYMYMEEQILEEQDRHFAITSYYDHAPLDEYGLIREPKYWHLKDLHAAVKLCSHPFWITK